MNKDWDESTLSSLRIHELRDLARKIGVKCPTALKKEDLINRSMQILNGETEPYKAKDGKGRPSKSESQINTLMGFFMPDKISFDDTINFASDDFDFAVEMPQVEYNAIENEVVEGLLEITSNGIGVLRVNNYETSENDVFVHDVFISSNKLKSGDYVKAYAKVVVNGRPRAVTKIISVNPDLISLPKQPSVTVANFNLKCGSNALVVSNVNKTDKIIDSLKGLKNTVNFYVSAYEKQPVENTENTTFVCVNPYKRFKDVYCAFNMAFNRAKVLSKQSSVVLVINKVSAWFRGLEAILCDKIDNQIKLNTVIKEEILKMLDLAKKNNITVLLFDSFEIEPHIKNFLQYELSQVVDLYVAD